MIQKIAFKRRANRAKLSLPGSPTIIVNDSDSRKESQNCLQNNRILNRRRSHWVYSVADNLCSGGTT
jgi:hypothetical protein